MISNGPKNVTVCTGTKAKITCGFTGVPDIYSVMPHWRIVRRNNGGDVLSNGKVSNNILKWNLVPSVYDNSANNSFLSVGPVDETDNNTSYQCVFGFDDYIIESTVGTITVIGTYTNIRLSIYSQSMINILLIDTILYMYFNSYTCITQYLLCQ